MNLKHFGIIAIIALSLTGCPPDSDPNPDPVHTHSYSAAWKSDATQHWRECSCGDKTGVADHDWQWVVTTPATTQADGLETETCKTCGATSGNTRPITKLEQPQDWTNETIDGISGLKISTISGTQLTPTQMVTVKSKISAAITAVQGGDDITTGAFLEDALTAGLLVELETTTEYTQYKKVGNGLRLNVNHALTALNEATFGSAVNAIYGIGPEKQ